MTADLDSFRAETRAWLEANCPDEVRRRDGLAAQMCDCWQTRRSKCGL